MTQTNDTRVGKSEATGVCLTPVTINGTHGFWAPALYFPPGTKNNAGQIAEYEFALRMREEEASNEMLIARSRAIEAAKSRGMRFLDRVVTA